MANEIMNNEVIKDVVETAAPDLDVGLIQKFFDELPQKAFTLGVRIILAALTLVLGLWLIKILRKLTRKTLEKANADKGLIQFVDSFMKFGLIGLLIITIALGFGLDATTVMAALGSVGVAFALAMQGSLSNCAGGVLILMQKIFVVGDYISIGDADSEGVVTEIGLFYTKLLTGDGKVITLPNGNLANSRIINFTHTVDRRLELDIGISYDDSVEKARQIVLSVIQKDDRILKTKDSELFIEGLGDSSVNLKVWVWVENSNYIQIKHELLEKLYTELVNGGISIPYPQVVVHQP